MKCPNCGSTEDMTLRLDNKHDNDCKCCGGKDYTLWAYCEACSSGADYYIQCEDGTLDELLEDEGIPKSMDEDVDG